MYDVILSCVLIFASWTIFSWSYHLIHSGHTFCFCCCVVQNCVYVCNVISLIRVCCYIRLKALLYMSVLVLSHWFNPDEFSNSWHELYFIHNLKVHPDLYYPLGMFTKWQRATAASCLSFSVHRTTTGRISWNFVLKEGRGLPKSIERAEFWLKSDKNSRHLCTLMSTLVTSLPLTVYACWVQNVVRVTVGCGISHKGAKYTIKNIGFFSCLFHQ